MQNNSSILIRRHRLVTIRSQKASQATSDWRRVARGAIINLSAGPMSTAAMALEDSDTPTE